MKGKKMTEKDIVKIFCNPFYAITINEIFAAPHQPIVSEEEFIKVGVKMIEEIGAEEYLKNLLSNLKGDYV